MQGTHFDIAFHHREPRQRDHWVLEVANIKWAELRKMCAEHANDAAPGRPAGKDVQSSGVASL